MKSEVKGNTGVNWCWCWSWYSLSDSCCLCCSWYSLSNSCVSCSLNRHANDSNFLIRSRSWWICNCCFKYDLRNWILFVEEMMNSYHRDFEHTLESIPRWIRYVWKFKLSSLEKVFVQPVIGHSNTSFRLSIVGSEFSIGVIKNKISKQERYVIGIVSEIGIVWEGTTDCTWYKVSLCFFWWLINPEREVYFLEQSSYGQTYSVVCPMN